MSSLFGKVDIMFRCPNFHFYLTLKKARNVKIGQAKRQVVESNVVKQNIDFLIDARVIMVLNFYCFYGSETWND